MKVIITSAIMLALALGWALLESAKDDLRRVRRRRTIITENDSAKIIGDGAWPRQTTQAKYPPPRSARVRDIEPRGA